MGLSKTKSDRRKSYIRSSKNKNKKKTPNNRKRQGEISRMACFLPLYPSLHVRLNYRGPMSLVFSSFRTLHMERGEKDRELDSTLSAIYLRGWETMDCVGLWLSRHRFPFRQVPFFGVNLEIKPGLTHRQQKVDDYPSISLHFHRHSTQLELSLLP